MNRFFLLGFGMTSLLVCASLQAGDFYSHKVVAKTQNSASGHTLVGMGDSPSINFDGNTAFVGQFSTGEGVVVADSKGSLSLISQSPQSNRFFGRAVQITDSNRVIAMDRVTGNPPFFFIRSWNASASSPPTTIAQNNGSTIFDAVFAFGSMNKDGAAVFAGLEKNGSDTLLATSQAGTGVINGPITMLVNSLPRPMISDEGTFVVKNGIGAADPLRLYAFNFSSSVTIADSNDFVELGNAPGISEDGRIVTFYGDVTPAGAAKYGAGRGIFASIDVGGSRRIFRLTGILIENISAPGGDDDGVCETGETCAGTPEAGYTAANTPVSFSTYSPANRVPITSMSRGATGIEDDTFVVAFMATPNSAGTNPVISAQQGIWTVRVDVRRQLDTNILDVISYTANAVAQVGDTIDGNLLTNLLLADGIAGVKTDLSDIPRTQIRGDHQVAFWASTTNGGQMVVRAVQNACLAPVPLLYKQGSTPWGPSLYDTHPKNKSIGAKGCALTSLSMALYATGVRKLPNGDANQPGKLNDYMLTNNGYDGSSVDWSNTVKSVKATFQFDSYGGSKNSIDSLGEAQQILDTAVCTVGVPIIVGVKIDSVTKKAGHFVIVTGKKGADYIIADPAGHVGDAPRTLNGTYNGRFSTRGSVKDTAQ